MNQEPWTGREVRLRRLNVYQISQAELGSKLGVHRITVARWEGNKTPVTQAIELAIMHLECGGRVEVLETTIRELRAEIEVLRTRSHHLRY